MTAADQISAPGRIRTCRYLPPAAPRMITAVDESSTKSAPSNAPSMTPTLRDTRSRRLVFAMFPVVDEKQLPWFMADEVAHFEVPILRHHDPVISISERRQDGVRRSVAVGKL